MARRRSSAAPSLVLGAVDSQARPSTKPHSIDVHHHMIPPVFGTLEEGQRAHPARDALDPQATSNQMDNAGVATAILSGLAAGLPADALSTGDHRRLVRQPTTMPPKARRITRADSASLRCADAGRRQSALKEIEYALDDIKADGIGLGTSRATFLRPISGR